MTSSSPGGFRRQGRGDRRRVVAWLGVTALLAGCTTTHAVGPAADPGTRAQLDGLASGGGAIVHLRGTPGVPASKLGYRITGVTPAGFLIEPVRGQPLLVSPPQVDSVSRYDHAWGTGDGAIAGGVFGLATGLALGILFTAGTNSSCSDGCSSQPDPLWVGARVGVVFGFLGSLLGAAVGAAAGHRVMLVPREP